MGLQAPASSGLQAGLSSGLQALDPAPPVVCDALDPTPYLAEIASLCAGWQNLTHTLLATEHDGVILATLDEVAIDIDVDDEVLDELGKQRLSTVGYPTPWGATINVNGEHTAGLVGADQLQNLVRLEDTSPPPRLALSDSSGPYTVDRERWDVTFVLRDEWSGPPVRPEPWMRVVILGSAQEDATITTAGAQLTLYFDLSSGSPVLMLSAGSAPSIVWESLSSQSLVSATVTPTEGALGYWNGFTFDVTATRTHLLGGSEERTITMRMAGRVCFNGMFPCTV